MKHSESTSRTRQAFAASLKKTGQYSAAFKGDSERVA